jgi:xanthine dehydrogenase YagT iron-sulfur-binding subunit
MRSPTSTLGDVSQRTTAMAALAAGSDRDTAEDPASATIALRINGRTHQLKVDLRATLLDTLRERIGLTGTKKGCDRGECGACTIHIDGRRVLSCMTLAVMAEGREITTIEGLAKHDELHPVQAAFIEHDAFQCGFCTPGQIMSAIACIREGHTGSDDEIREFMSGNLCRCSAYPQIVAAVRAAASTPGI